MTQFVTRLDTSMAAAIDQLVDDGVVDSRSDAVRKGLAALLDRHRRDRVGAAIVTAYESRPQTEEDVGWADAATAQMVAEEPW